MTLRTIVSRLARAVLPEQAIARIKQHRMNVEHPPPFGGAFDSFAAAAAADAATGFGDESYTANLRDITLRRMRGMAETFPDVHGQSAHLALLAATMPGDIDILDFGGATGCEYAHVRACVKDTVRRIGYHVVDMPEIIAIGRECWAGHAEISFSTELPEGRRFDLVHCGSSLQYVEEFEPFLRRLAGYGPRCIAIMRTPVHQGRRCVRLNNNLKRPVPNWLFNIDELVRIMESAGYGLAMRSTSGEMFNVSNYPPAMQVGWLTNLLFVRR
jgi:putative methyltransferase (TIGR04325 family)